MRPKIPSVNPTSTRVPTRVVNDVTPHELSWHNISVKERKRKKGGDVSLRLDDLITWKPTGKSTREGSSATGGFQFNLVVGYCASSRHSVAAATRLHPFSLLALALQSCRILVALFDLLPRRTWIRFRRWRRRCSCTHQFGRRPYTLSSFQSLKREPFVH